MSDKKGFMGLAALAAAGAGAAMLMKKTREINEEENLSCERKLLQTTATPSVESMTKTAKGFIIPTVTTKPLPVRKNRKVWTTSMPTL